MARIAWCLGLAALAALTAGCGADSGAEAKATDVQTDTVAHVKEAVSGTSVRMMLSTGEKNLNDLVAYRAADCVKKTYNMDVKFVIVADAGVTTVQAVLANQVNLAEVSVGQIGDAVQQGADLEIFAPHDIQNDYVMVAKDSVADPGDMAGKVHGAAALTGQDPYNFKTIYKDAGVDGKVKTVLIGGSSDRVAALLSGKVDATMLHPYDAATVVAKGGFHIIATAATDVPPLVADVFFSQRDWLNGHKATAVAWTSCVFAEADWIYANPDDALNFAMSQVPNLDEATTKTTLADLSEIKFWGQEPLNAASVQHTLDTEEAGKVKAVKILATAVMNDAMKLHAEVTP